jgi:hypothetical protein
MRVVKSATCTSGLPVSLALRALALTTSAVVAFNMMIPFLWQSHTTCGTDESDPNRAKQINCPKRATRIIASYLPSFFFSLPLGMMLVVIAARIGSSVDVLSFGGDLSFLGFFASLPPWIPFAMMLSLKI